MKLLKKRTALITGASRGIGRSIALAFAEAGADIIFTSTRADENTRSLLLQLESLGVRAGYFQSDASDYTQTQALAAAVSQQFDPLDVLVNNAGIVRDNLLLRMSETDWNTVIDTDLRSVFNYCKAFVPVMLQRHKGAIINISSVVAINGNSGQCNYAAAKAGIIGFTRSLAKELGRRNIRCNAVAPGFIETRMTKSLDPKTRQEWLAQIPLHRPGTENEVAQLCLFLASDMSQYITGQTICCDGGLSL